MERRTRYGLVAIGIVILGLIFLFAKRADARTNQNMSVYMAEYEQYQADLEHRELRKKEELWNRYADRIQRLYAKKLEDTPGIEVDDGTVFEESMDKVGTILVKNDQYIFSNRDKNILVWEKKDDVFQKVTVVRNISDNI